MLRRTVQVACGLGPLSKHLTLGCSRSFAGAVQDAKATAMLSIHEEAGGKLVDFEGYKLPVQYASQGIVAETLWCRSKASIFDVSHMGQVHIHGADTAKFLEMCTPTDVQGISAGEGRYSLLLNETGGIIDDCIITQMKDYTNVVLNAGCKEKDLDFLQVMLNEAKASGTVSDCSITHLEEQQLIALQGPAAASVLQSMLPVEDLSTMGFMQAREVMLDTGNSLHKVFIVRCGYTGEDGFEISFKAEDVDSIVRRIAADDNVQLAGLGARDALRLEAGLPLYGNDINEDTTPVEAGLLFAISKNRRQTGGFNGSEKILKQISDKSWTRKRVGLQIEGRAPSRAGDLIFNDAGDEVGVVTSGTFSPTLKAPVAMGYVFKGNQVSGTPLSLQLRGNRTAKAVVAKMPFVPQTYFRPKTS